MSRIQSRLSWVIGEIPDEADLRRSRLVVGTAGLMVPMSVVFLCGQLMFGVLASQLLACLAFCMSVSVLVLHRLGHARAGRLLFVAGLGTMATVSSLASGGIASGAFAMNLVVAVFAAILLPRWTLPIFLVVPIAVGVLHLGGFVEPKVVFPPAFHLFPWTIALLLILVVVSGLVYQAESAITEADEGHREAATALERLAASSLSNEHLQAVLDALEEFVFVVGSQGEICSTNRAVREAGHWGDTLIGRHVESLFKGVEEGNSRQVQMVRADGGMLDVVLSRTPLGGADADRTVWAATDVTELARIAEALRSAHRQSTAANNAKSNFLANMSHELRTPLNAIIGYSELLSDEIEGPEAKQDLGRIVGAATSLLNLINGVLDLSKVEAGKVDLHLDHTGLADLVESTLAFVRPHAASKGLELTLRAPIDPELRIYTDDTKVRQVLLNLLSNSIKFTSSGSVDLEVEVWERSKLPWVRFLVTDTGRGMTAEALAVVFEPFTQAHSDGSTKQEGTGLGLSICRAYIEMLGGQIYAESTVDQGSRFVVEVPAAELAHLTPGRTPLIMPDGPATGQVVLVVDDDQSFVDLVGRALLAEGREVIGATDPQQALQWAMRNRADLVVLDVDMPAMSGWAFMVRLRTSRCAETPVLVVSGSEEHDVAEALGSSGVLTKPVSPSTLRAEVDTLLR